MDELVEPAGEMPIPPNPKILIVDDDTSICDVLKRLLDKELDNPVITVVHDGEAAVNALDPGLDLMILDMNLPKIRGEGVSVANELKNVNVPILIITGGPAPDMEFMGDINLMGILFKPLENNEVVNAVKTILTGQAYPQN